MSSKLMEFDDPIKFELIEIISSISIDFKLFVLDMFMYFSYDTYT